MTRQNWLYWHQAIDVDDLLKNADLRHPEEATTFGGERPEYRRSKVKWLSDHADIKQKLWEYVGQAANSFEILTSQAAEVQYTEYHASDGGKYDWHHDVDWNSGDIGDRKLSVVVQLSDPSEYEGGYFEFQDVENPKEEMRDKGTILVFPSLLLHRVTPVTSGVRKSLVAWFEGPPWR